MPILGLGLVLHAPIMCQLSEFSLAIGISHSSHEGNPILCLFLQWAS